ncbi:4Fe-4S dicluster domain-containing protein [Candidatus Bathyarchaeota archaeon]|nr:4Fe-4S dicluster domain-containing protein [Candidatus Bathyarchaeota archaeon]
MRKSVFIDPDKCTGCGVCELTCTAFHEKKYGLRKSRIRNVKIGDIVRISVTCRLCDKPPCVTVCPKGALRQSVETGVILVDEKKCHGCGWCIQACQFGVMFLHPTKKVVIACDLCNGDPQCVKDCPEEALEMTTTDAFSSKVRGSAIRALMGATKEK